VNVVGLVPMAHVADLPRSIAFYEKLGFTVGGSWAHEGGGKMVWASLVRDGNPQLYISQADAPVDPTQQAVLFYLYSKDLVALRAALVGHGIAVGEITHPAYMKEGEIRLEDPDGYVLLVGQTDS
jgi:catechol 2,3-dioxygenase-like lactoylglutathione lyase family enzyme